MPTRHDPERPPRVLVVEDDPSTRRTVAVYLRDAGFEVACCTDGAAGLAAAEELAPDLVVLDLMLPGMDGREVCRRLREHGDVPVIMLTARVAEADRVEGLELGADDYVPKPFSPRELVARVRAVLRRRPPAGAAGILRRGALEIDRDRHLVVVGGAEVPLTPSEMTVLSALAGSPGRVFARAQLAARLASGGRAPLERTVDTHVLNLRKKVERDPRRPRRIETVAGVGYRFADDGERS
jgi:DNA-binding response OmpR family regulator